MKLTEQYLGPPAKVKHINKMFTTSQQNQFKVDTKKKKNFQKRLCKRLEYYISYTGTSLNHNSLNQQINSREKRAGGRDELKEILRGPFLEM